MIGSPHRRSRTGMWYAAFAIVSLLLLLASQTDVARTVQRASARALDPLRQAVSGFGQGIATVFGTIGEIDRLRTENGELRRLLGLTQSLDMELMPVRVISRDPSNFTWEVGIDAGTDDGLAIGMPVIGAAEGASGTAAGALAGTVVDVGPDSATVRLVVDTRSSVVALDQRSRALGLVQGQLGGQLVMVQINSTDEITVGDAVVSAGLELSDQAARSPYPKGLLIGHVQAVAPDENALTQTAFLRAALDFNRIERLLVIRSFRQD